jgi:membrane-anchored mycosin MYCP
MGLCRRTILVVVAGLLAVVALALPFAASPALGASIGCAGHSQTVSRAVPWAQAQLQPTATWGLTRGAGQLVAVLDGGVSARAPALAGGVLPGLIVGTRRNADTDCSGHGTFVAGLIAARPTRLTGFAGLAPQARILPVNVYDQDGSVTSAAVAAGLSYAVAAGATVIDFSAASTPAPSPALKSAVARAIAAGVVIIAWVNDNGLQGVNQASYPADYPGVIAVVAVDGDGNPLAAGVRTARVDLAAPGQDITSIGPLGPGEQTGSGAALATGYVAGAAALVRAYYPDLSAASVVRRLELTASQFGVAVPNFVVGYGVVDPYQAVSQFLPASSRPGGPLASTPAGLRLPRPKVFDTRPGSASALLSVLVALAVIAALACAHVVRTGHRRGWRPPSGT